MHSGSQRSRTNKPQPQPQQHTRSSCREPYRDKAGEQAVRLLQQLMGRAELADDTTVQHQHEVSVDNSPCTRPYIIMSETEKRRRQMPQWNHCRLQATSLPTRTALAMYSTAQHNTTQRNTAQHSTAQHNATHHTTPQHNTTQHNAAFARTQLDYWHGISSPSRCATVITVESLNTVRMAAWIFASVSRSTLAVGSSLRRQHKGGKQAPSGAAKKRAQ